MLITRRLRVLKPLLAAKPNQDKENPRREFSRLPEPPKGKTDDKIYLMSDLARWQWAFLEARDSLGFEDVAVSAIRPGRWYSVTRTSTYNRQFTRGRRMLKEAFEALSTGQVFEMEFVVSKHVPPGTDGNGRFTRTPDIEEFDEMLEFIGDQLGMSEWGHALQHGRFEIQKFTQTNESTSAEHSDAPGDGAKGA